MKSKGKAANVADDWRQALALNRGLLESYTSYLLPCSCTREIVAQVENDVRNFIVPDGFKTGYLLRIMAQIIIAHLRKCTEQSDECAPGSSADCMSSIERLPTQERLVYFLRVILECRTRDASLLLGISDAQVEELLSLAQRRFDGVRRSPNRKPNMQNGSTSVGDSQTREHGGQTRGNPFFILMFMCSLAEERLLHLDHEAACCLKDPDQR